MIDERKEADTKKACVVEHDLDDLEAQLAETMRKLETCAEDLQQLQVEREAEAKARAQVEARAKKRAELALATCDAKRARVDKAKRTDNASQELELPPSSRSVSPLSIYQELRHLHRVQATSVPSADTRWLRSRPIVACRLLHFHRRFGEALALTVRVYEADAARIRFGVFHPSLASGFVFEVQEENDHVQLVSSIRMEAVA